MGLWRWQASCDLAVQAGGQVFVRPEEVSLRFPVLLVGVWALAGCIDVPTFSSSTSSDAVTADAIPTDSVTLDVLSADVPTADVPSADVPTADLPTADLPTADVPTTDLPTDARPDGAAETVDTTADTTADAGPISTEFATDDLSAWSRLSDLTGDDPVPYSELSVDPADGGWLRIVPRGRGWFEEHRGALLYQDVTGDFAVVARVEVSRLSEPSQNPQTELRIAGLLARDPAGIDATERWILHDVGAQLEWLGTATKSTAPNVDNTASVTTLRFEELPANVTRTAGLIGICRVGSTFRFHRRLDGESSFGGPADFDRPDLPNTLQVGVFSGQWPEETIDVLGRFDWVRFETPASLADCQAAIERAAAQ